VNNAADPGTQAHGTTEIQGIAPGTQPQGAETPGIQPPGLKENATDPGTQVHGTTENNAADPGTRALAPPYVYANRVVDTEEASADSVKQKEKVPSIPEKRKATNQVPRVPGSTLHFV
jgi:hypothetical protein